MNQEKNVTNKNERAESPPKMNKQQKQGSDRKGI